MNGRRKDDWGWWQIGQVWSSPVMRHPDPGASQSDAHDVWLKIKTRLERDKSLNYFLIYNLG